MIRYCKSCLFPETKPDLYFDEHGECDACVSARKKNQQENAIDWDQRSENFSKILDETRDKKPSGYNCLVP